MWQALSMKGAPPPEELFGYLLTKYFDTIGEEIRNHISKPPMLFSTMLLHPILDRWDKKWERECAFQARLYDFNNSICAESACASRDSAMQFVHREMYKDPQKYSRYVLLIKTPFNEQQVIYTIEGGYSLRYICRVQAAEWKATFYDSMDQEVLSFRSTAPMERKYLMRNLRGNAFFTLCFLTTMHRMRTSPCSIAIPTGTFIVRTRFRQ